MVDLSAPPPAMTGDEFNAAIKSLGLRKKWLAERLGVAPQTLSRWVKGELPVPAYAAFALDLLRHHSTA